jgi:hypothetical protein
VKTIDGYLVVPFAASEVEVGWTILIRDWGLYEVVGREFSEPRREGEDRQLTLRVHRPPMKFTDEGNLVVYRVIGKAEAE